jgi:hypothetical protein
MMSCGGGKETKRDTSSLLVGDWKVQWITTPGQNEPANAKINYTMNGEMLIQADGSITINAFGYEDCIFGADTLKHTLKWELTNDSTMNLSNEGDKFGIPYTIKELSEKKAKLQLVEDVYLFLKKD